MGRTRPPPHEWGGQGSLGTAGVGCPEHAQVGPLPRLSKSRLSGHLVGLADSGVPFTRVLGKPHLPPLFGSTANATTACLAGPREHGARPAGTDRPLKVRPASG